MRVKTGFTRRRHHKKVLKRTRGMRMTKGRLYKVSREAELHQGQYAYIGRRVKKRDLRRLWIQRINAGLRQIDPTFKYSKFIHQLNSAKVTLNRKMLADLAATDFEVFKKVVASVAK